MKVLDYAPANTGVPKTFCQKIYYFIYLFFITINAVSSLLMEWSVTNLMTTGALRSHVGL